MRKIIILLFLISLFVLGISAYPQPPNYPEKKDRNTANSYQPTNNPPLIEKIPTTKNFKQDTAEERNNQKDKVPPDWWVVGANWVLVGIVLLQAIILAFQCFIMKRQSESLPRIERAYLSVIVEMDPISATTHYAGDMNFSAKVIVNNDGKTPATITKIAATIEMRKAIPKIYSAIEEIEIVDNSIPVGKGLLENVQVFSDIRIENNRIIILGGKTILYCYGRIEYEDIFNNSQYTLFCWQYSHKFYGAVRTKNADLNYST